MYVQNWLIVVSTIGSYMNNQLLIWWMTTHTYFTSLVFYTDKTMMWENEIYVKIKSATVYSFESINKSWWGVSNPGYAAQVAHWIISVLLTITWENTVLLGKNLQYFEDLTLQTELQWNIYSYLSVLLIFIMPITATVWFNLSKHRQQR